MGDQQGRRRRDGGRRGWEPQSPLSLQHFTVGTYYLAGHHHNLGRDTVWISMSVFQSRRQKPPESTRSISDAQCERGQNGDQDGRVKEVTGQARSPGVEGSHRREGRKRELGPDSFPQPGHQGPQGSPSGLRASLSPYLEMPSFSLNRPPLSPPGLCGSPSGAPRSPSAGQHAHHSSVLRLGF